MIILRASGFFQQLVILFGTSEDLSGVLFLQPEFFLFLAQMLYLSVEVLDLLLVNLGLLQHALLEGQPLFN